MDEFFDSIVDYWYILFILWLVGIGLTTFCLVTPPYTLISKQQGLLMRCNHKHLSVSLGWRYRRFMRRKRPTGALFLILASLACIVPSPTLGSVFVIGGIISPPKPVGLSSSPAPSGSDDTAALQAWITSITPVVQKGILQAGTFKISASLKMKAGVEIVGIDRRYTILENTANVYTFEPLEGDNVVENMSLIATTKQTAGGVIDFTKGFSLAFALRHAFVGNNFFQSFNMEIYGSGISFEDVSVQGLGGGGVINYTEPAFKIGKKTGGATEKITVVKMVKCRFESSNIGGKRVPIWLDVVNCDSMHLYDCEFQFGEAGIRIGHEDTSVNKTSGFKMVESYLDHSTNIAIEVENARDCRFNVVCVQGGGEGVVIGKECFGVAYQNGVVQSQNKNGIHLLASSSNYGTAITGNMISDNNQLGEAEAAKIAGIKVEGGAGNFQIKGNQIGGMLVFTGKQQFGVVVLKGTNNAYAISGNRIPEKGTGPAENTIKAIVDEGEGATKEVGPNVLA